MNVTSGS